MTSEGAFYILGEEEAGDEPSSEITPVPITDTPLAAEESSFLGTLGRIFWDNPDTSRVERRSSQIAANGQAARTKTSRLTDAGASSGNPPVRGGANV